MRKSLIINLLKSSNIVNFTQIIFFLFYQCYVNWNITQEGDVGCFMSIGHELRSGKILYKEVWDNKAPGIFFIHEAFQFITNKNLNYPVLLNLFFNGLFIIIILILINRYINTALLKIVTLNLTILFFLLVSNQWAFFLVRGFTEEIGSLLFLAGFLPFLIIIEDDKTWRFRDSLLLVSGFFIGISFLIKEPFIFNYFAILILMLLAKSRSKFKIIGYLHIGILITPLLFLIYLIRHKAICYYMQYLDFAFNYANRSFLSPFEKIGYAVKQYVNILEHDEPSILYFQLIFILIFTIVISFKRNTLFSELLLVGIVTLIICQVPFFVLTSEVLYSHYFIPLLLVSCCFPFFLNLIISKYFNKISIRRMQLYFNIILICILFFVLIKNNYRNSTYNSFNCADEAVVLQNSVLLNSHCFIDDQSAGRFYFYLNAHSNLPFPSPYYVYFLFGKNEKGNGLILKNNLRFQQEFNKNPPQFILSKEKLSVAFDYNRFYDYVNSTYSVIDSVKINSTQYLIRKRN